MSFRHYVLTRKYGFGRGSRASWAFIAEARGDPDFPDPASWPELRAYLQMRGTPEHMIRAARTVWGSYQSRRDRAARPAHAAGVAGQPRLTLGG